jgi:DNA-binding helix-hairpin-helix protein with protein kinase domain
MQLDRLFVLKSNYETIEKEYKNALASLQHATREWQQKKFLEQYTIKDFIIPHIREDQTIRLRSYGIRTAADITRSNLAGRCQLDRVQVEELLSWRKNLEKLFLFDPSKGPDKSDTLALIHRYQPRLKPVERELQSGINKLVRTHQEILYNRTKYQPLVEKSAKELSQAEVNVKAMKILGIF